jgi:hypothetical protein
MRKIFVRCGNSSRAPSTDWETIELPAFLSASDILESLKIVKEKILEKNDDVQLLIAGPIVLGVALGQVLEHIPIKIEYVQLNQKTKRFEVWWDNTRHI